jgi:hypothetical protein
MADRFWFKQFCRAGIANQFGLIYHADSTHLGVAKSKLSMMDT